MCGIAGILNLADRVEPPSVKVLSRMIGAIRHRGPDEFGYYRDHHIGMAHARLSILDLETGNQPMSNEDGWLWIVFNGQIFNYVELKAELEKLEHKFRTKSDTEVLLHAFEQWGTDCFHRFNGQWALAIWNKREQSLLLARDRVGVRPLYVQGDRDVLRFGSEVKSLFADPAVRRALDPIGINQVFTYWAPVAPRTVFEGIEELKPGHTEFTTGMAAAQILCIGTLGFQGAVITVYE